MDYERMLRFSLLDWKNDWLTIKYGLAFIGIMVLIGGALILAAVALLGPEPLGAFSNTTSLDPTVVMNSLSNIVVLFALSIPLIFIWIVVNLYITILIQLRSLQLAGKKVAPFDLQKFLRFIVMGVWVSIASSICWYQKRVLFLLFRSQLLLD